MSTQAETITSGPKGLWTKTARFIEAMEDASGPMDSYVLALGKRVEKLERDVERLEGQLHPYNLGNEIQPLDTGSNSVLTLAHLHRINPPIFNSGKHG